jgi:hypothetical protein
MNGSKVRAVWDVGREVVKGKEHFFIFLQAFSYCLVHMAMIRGLCCPGRFKASQWQLITSANGF